jgi:hypothetical protein
VSSAAGVFLSALGLDDSLERQNQEPLRPGGENSVYKHSRMANDYLRRPRSCLLPGFSTPEQHQTTGSKRATRPLFSWHYEVELRKPILTSYLDLDAPIAHLAGTGTSSSTPFSAFTKPIDTFLGGLSVSGLVITIPSGNPGRYMYAMGSGSSLTQATWGTFTYTNARQLNMNAAGANSAVFNDACSAITQSANSSTVYVAVFDVLDASQATTITISYGTVAGSLSHSDFYIARISSSGTAY